MKNPNRDPQLNILTHEVFEFESFLLYYFKNRFKNYKEEGILKLQKAIEHTLFAPCKRFRPILSLAVCKTLGIDYKKSFPLASAIELIHTASIIHDDLPSMDNDSQRRGREACHITFKEDMALLAGDSLFVEAFFLLSYFNQKPDIIECIARRSSLEGMMGGQALDLRTPFFTEKNIQKLHKMKTASLIQAALEAPLFLKEIQEEQARAIKECAKNLGLAFQIADDLEDKNLDEPASILKVMSEKRAREKLNDHTKTALNSIDLLGQKADSLKKVILSNKDRVCSL